MSVQQEVSGAQPNGVLDTAKLLLAAVLAAGGIVAFYWFAASPMWQRILMVVAGAATGAALALTSQAGRDLWEFVDGSRVELKKMVWPTRQEALQTTLVLVVFVVILGVIMLFIDMGLNWAIERLLGRA